MIAHVSLFCLLSFHLFTYPKAKSGEDRIKRTLRTEELAGDVEGFTSHDDYLLAVQQLLGDGAGQATEKVSLAVNNDLTIQQQSVTTSPTSNIDIKIGHVMGGGKRTTGSKVDILTPV